MTSRGAAKNSLLPKKYPVPSKKFPDNFFREFGCKALKSGPESGSDFVENTQFARIPIKFPDNRENGAEIGSLETASTTTQSPEIRYPAYSVCIANSYSSGDREFE
jgi:hypothetical protein